MALARFNSLPTAAPPLRRFSNSRPDDRMDSRMTRRFCSRRRRALSLINVRSATCPAVSATAAPANVAMNRRRPFARGGIGGRDGSSSCGSSTVSVSVGSRAGGVADGASTTISSEIVRRLRAARLGSGRDALCDGRPRRARRAPVPSGARAPHGIPSGDIAAFAIPPGQRIIPARRRRAPHRRAATASSDRRDRRGTRLTRRDPRARPERARGGHPERARSAQHPATQMRPAQVSVAPSCAACMPARITRRVSPIQAARDSHHEFARSDSTRSASRFFLTLDRG